MYDVNKIAGERALPSVMTMASGKPVKTLTDFEKRREEIRAILKSEMYGEIPEAPEHLSVEVLSLDAGFLAGKAIRRDLRFNVTVRGELFSFPVTSVIPTKGGAHPAFVHINFRPDVPDKYLPSEELCDEGFAVFSFCYKDVTSDDGDMKNGICEIFSRGKRASNAPGKIAMWAFAAMRVMDYIETLPEIDHENVAVIGHSRLGKTALVTGAFDERFKYVISNDSGCSGAAITRMKLGENVAIITSAFPFWFCPKYQEYAGREEALPFDQHFLTSLIAPRHLMIGSAEEDIWADPESEFLGCALANDAYAMYGMRGLIFGAKVPEAKTVLDKGDSLYQVRHGKHYLSREDWIEYCAFIKKCIRSE